MILMKNMKEDTGMGYAPICAKEDSIWKSVRIGLINGDEKMLVPEIVNKIKFGVVNGKIVPTGTVGVEQLVGYDMNDFTEEDLRSLIQAGHEDYFDDSEKDKLRELGILGKVKISPSLILRAWRYDNYYLYDTNDVPHYDSYSSEIPELETSSISIKDARYLGYYMSPNNDGYGSNKYTGVYITIETNSDGAVSINQEFSDYAGFSSKGNGKYLVLINNSPGGTQNKITVTKDLIITVGETGTYEELSKTLSITFVNGSGIMEPDKQANP